MINPSVPVKNNPLGHMLAFWSWEGRNALEVLKRAIHESGGDMDKPDLSIQKHRFLFEKHQYIEAREQELRKMIDSKYSVKEREEIYGTKIEIVLRAMRDEQKRLDLINYDMLID